LLHRERKLWGEHLLPIWNLHPCEICLIGLHKLIQTWVHAILHHQIQLLVLVLLILQQNLV